MHFCRQSPLLQSDALLQANEPPEDTAQDVEHTVADPSTVAPKTAAVQNLLPAGMSVS